MTLNGTGMCIPVCGTNLAVVLNGMVFEEQDLISPDFLRMRDIAVASSAGYICSVFAIPVSGNREHNLQHAQDGKL